MKIQTQIQIQVKPWFAKKQHLYSRVLSGEILVETERAYLFEGSASTVPNEYCHNCGRKIENPVSVQVGYGPVCSDRLGIPRELPQDEEGWERLRQMVAMKTKWKGWIPKSVVMELMSI